MTRELLAEYQYPQLLIDPYGGRVPPFEVPSTTIWQNEYKDRSEPPSPEVQTAKIKQVFEQNYQQHLLLEGSGFDVLDEVKSITASYSEGVRSGLERNEIKRLIVDKVEQNVRSFYWEFLVREPLLSNRMKITENGLVSPKYGNQKVVDAVNSDERKGAYIIAVNELEKKLKSAEDGAVFLFTSPPGWTGMTDQDGNELTLPESQTYVFQKQGETIDCVTIRSSMTLSDHIELLRDLGETITVEDEEETIVSVSSTVVDLTEKVRGGSASEVVQLISNAMNSEQIWFDKNSNKTWTVEQMVKKIGSIEDLERADTVTEQKISSLKDFLDAHLSDCSTHELITIAEKLGKTVIEIKHLFDRPAIDPVANHIQKTSTAEVDVYVAGISYQQEANKIQHLGGCKTRNANTSIEQSPFGPREVSTGGEDKYGSLEFDCPHCGKTNSRPRNKLIKNCQKCGKDVSC